MEVRNSTKRGVTLIELLTATSLSVLVVFLLAQTSIMSTATFDKVQNTSYSINKGRVAFDGAVSDIKLASAILCKYPTKSAPTFTALDNKVLILKQPVFDSSNNVKPNEFKIVIFSLESTTTPPTPGSGVLKKYVARVVGNVEGAVSLEGVVCKDVASATMEVATNQIFWGNNSDKEFWLATTPESATADIKNEILVGGANRLDDGRATLVGNKVTFGLAPANGVIVDATYKTNENGNIDGQGSNGGTSVFFRLTIRTNWRTTGGTTQSRNVTLTARPTLMNKED